MKADDPRLLALVAAISDGDSIDWDVDSGGEDGAEDRRAVIRSLRIVAGVAEVHRQVQAALLPPSQQTGPQLPDTIKLRRARPGRSPVKRSD